MATPIPKPPKKITSAITKPKIAPPKPVKKVFTTEAWNGDNEGEKIIIYGESGMGKTTLSAMAPNPVYIGLDDGGRKLVHPKTGELLNRIPDIDNYGDVRAALQQLELFDNFDTVVIDTVTELQDIAVPWMLDHISGPKGSVAKNIVDYGYNKGWSHLYDVMKYILNDCDTLIKRGKNVILVAQSYPIKVANPGGDDFLCEAPHLYAGTPSIEALYRSWADHILRIAYVDTKVKDKKASSANVRGIFTAPEVYYRAKSRTLARVLEDSVVSFESADDDSIWSFMFGGVK